MPRNPLRVLLIIFSCYSSIQYFSWVLSVSIIYFKIVLFSLHAICLCAIFTNLVEFSIAILEPSIITIIISCKFFRPASADGLSLEFEGQHVSSSFQDSPQYSGRSQKCNSFDGHLIYNSPIPFSKPFGGVPSAPITIGITVTLMFRGVFIRRQGLSTCLSFGFL